MIFRVFLVFTEQGQPLTSTSLVWFVDDWKTKSLNPRRARFLEQNYLPRERDEMKEKTGKDRIG